VIAFINVQDVHEYIKELERYLRFLAAVPIYLFVRNIKLMLLSIYMRGLLLQALLCFVLRYKAIWPILSYLHKGNITKHFLESRNVKCRCYACYFTDTKSW